MARAKSTFRIWQVRCGQWLATVEDFDLQLEDNADEGLSLREQEDAANDLVGENNKLVREEVRCAACGTGHSALSHATLSAACCACSAPMLLPPATPLLERALDFDPESSFSCCCSSSSSS